MIFHWILDAIHKPMGEKLREKTLELIMGSRPKFLAIRC